MHLKKDKKRARHWALLFIAAPVLFFVLLFGIAQTGVGKRQISRLLAAGLSKPGEMAVEVGKIEGFLPCELQLDRLAFSDNHGEWLSIESIVLRWSPFALFRGRVRVSVLSAGVMELSRLPASHAEGEGAAKGDLPWPDALEGLTIKRLSVEQLTLGADVLGKTGRFRLEGSIEGRAEADSVAAALAGKVSILDPLSPSLDALLANEVNYASKVILTEQKSLIIQEFQFEALTASLTGAASFDLVDEGVDGSWHLVVPELSTVRGSPGPALGGSLQLDGEVHGSLKALGLNVEAKARDLLMGKWQFREMAASLQAEGLPSEGTGNLRLELRQDEEQINAMADFATRGPLLTLTNLSMEAGANALTGALAVELDRHLVEGELQGKCDRLSDFGPFIGEELAGSAELKSQFAIVESGQHVTFRLLGTELKSAFGRAGNVVVQGELTNAFKSPEGTTRCEIEGFRAYGLTLDSLVLTAEGNPKQVTFTGSTEGRYGEGFQIQASGKYMVTPQGESLEISQLQGDYASLPLTLTRPAAILSTSEGYTVGPLALEVGGGQLESSARFEGAAFTLDASIDLLPVKTLGVVGVPNLSGTLTGNIRLHGRPEQPEGSIVLQVQELALRDRQFEGLPPVILAAQGELNQGRLRSELTLRGLTGPPFDADLDIPLELSLWPFASSIPAEGRLDGHVSGEMELAWLPLLLSLEDHSMEGLMEMSLALEGTAGTPQIAGRGVVRKGAYENYQTGLVLKDIELVVAAKTPRVTIEKATATDGEQGVISAQGWLDLLPDKGFPFSTRLTMDQVTLVRVDYATASAGGELTFSGSLGEQSLSGQLQVKEAELNIPNRLPPEMTDLEVIEIHGAEEEPGGERAEVSQPSHLELDIEVASPGRVSLRGRGLDSEWKGRLRVTGNAREPVLTGRFSVVRGHFDFLGKRFSLKRGTLTLDGAVPPLPYLDALGEASAEDMTAQLQLSGDASALEVTLSSDPELPSEEILSRLLFGRSVSNISPMQAARLALALRTLRGDGGGYDFMGSARRLLGVDQLEVKQSGERMEGASISAGKYLMEGVYLEVEKGSGPESGKTSVEVEITPNITVETDVGENAEGGIGINWKKNY